MIAALPMYDWPEERGNVDRNWTRIRSALVDIGLYAPENLTRDQPLDAIWLSPDLLLAQTCTYPLETILAGRVNIIGTPVCDAPGCDTQGNYRSVIIACRKAPCAQVAFAPRDDAHLPELAGLSRAANGADSMSGYVALNRDLEAKGYTRHDVDCWTGSHRASVIAVAKGKADFAAVDCVSWQLALRHERAAQDVKVIGWTAPRPGLPLITSAAMSASQCRAIRSAVAAVIPLAG